MKLPVGESDRTPRQPGYYRQASCPRRALHFKSGVPSAHITLTLSRLSMKAKSASSMRNVVNQMDMIRCRYLACCVRMTVVLFEPGL